SYAGGKHNGKSKLNSKGQVQLCKLSPANWADECHHAFEDLKAALDNSVALPVLSDSVQDAFRLSNAKANSSRVPYMPDCSKCWSFSTDDVFAILKTQCMGFRLSKDQVTHKRCCQFVSDTLKTEVLKGAYDDRSSEIFLARDVMDYVLQYLRCAICKSPDPEARAPLKSIKTDPNN
ncbi:hypothetical protein XENOCAPTIV_023687, partial [Xenoophorus captivus]